MKPILNIDEMIEHMKEKGIKFNIISENEAKQYKFMISFRMKIDKRL